jgi:hypothetical protein
VVKNNENNKIGLYYFSKERLIKLATNKATLMAPKSSGSKQIRLSSSILIDADMTGTIIFPLLNDEDYENFLIGDETTTNTINTLNKLGNKYGVRGLGGQLPQDVVMDLAKSQQFITDMNFILGGEKQ